MSTERWEIDSRSSQVRFAIAHFVVSRVRGRFGRWSGRVQVPDGDWTRATVEAVIDASSIETGIDKRDAHLRSADYLDVKRYPDITFRGRLLPHGADGSGRLVGDLILKGRTHEVSLEVRNTGVSRDRWGNDRAGFSARADIDRRQFGITGNMALDSGGVLIGTNIEVDIEVEAVRQPAVRVA